MLQIIRSKATSIVAKILFVLLIASFAIWGVGDTIFGNPAGRAAVEVDGDVRVTAVEAANEFDRARRRLGFPLTVDQAIQIGVLDQTLQNLAVQSVMVAATSRLGLSASDAQIVELIRQQFRDRLGQFDRTAYTTYLASNGWSEEDFVSRARRDLARNQLVNAVTGYGDEVVPQSIVSAIHAYREERRVADVVRVAAADMPAPSEPDSAALTAYYDERRTDYEAPEYRGLSWLAISAQSLASGIQIPDDELRAAFEEHADSFSAAGSRTVDQILFEEEAAARAAYERVSQGEDFAAVAQDTVGLDAAGIDLGSVTRDSLPEGTAAGVFAITDAGGVTEPLESPFGWHLFRIREATIAKPATFEDVKDRLAHDLALERAYDLVFERSNALEDLLAGGSTLVEASQKLSLPLNQIAAVSRDGQVPDGGTATTLPGDPFLEIAFATESGQQSTLNETQDGTYFILRVDGVEAARVPELSEIRATVVRDWIAEQRMEAAETLADAIAEAVNAGTSIADIAAQHDLSVERLAAMTRRGQGLTAGWPSALTGVLFGLKNGKAGVASDDQGAVVTALVEVVKGGGDAAAPADAVRQELSASVSSDIVELLVTDMEDRHEVLVNRDAVRQLFSVADTQQ